MLHILPWHSRSIKPTAHCHFHGSLCLDLAQPYPTTAGYREKIGAYTWFWRSPQQWENRHSGVSAFQVIDGARGLLACMMLRYCQAQCFPCWSSTQSFLWAWFPPAPTQAGRSPSLPANALFLPQWNWHLEAIGFAPPPLPTPMFPTRFLYFHSGYVFATLCLLLFFHFVW